MKNEQWQNHQKRNFFQKEGGASSLFIDDSGTGSLINLFDVSIVEDATISIIGKNVIFSFNIIMTSGYKYAINIPIDAKTKTIEYTNFFRFKKKKVIPCTHDDYFRDKDALKVALLHFNYVKAAVKSNIRLKSTK